jgi:Outer membrane protein beta-barrel domain
MILRNKLPKYRIVSGASLIVFLVCSVLAHAQYYTNKKFADRNNPNYDERRKLTYGFLIGLHTTAYQVKYSDLFVDQQLDSVFSVEPTWKQGFVLGFIVNYRVSEFLDLRITPQVAFYEHSLTYRYTDVATNPADNIQTIETTMVELPILAKYKSVRRGNVRMYMIGGIKPGLEASGKKDVDALTTRLGVKEFNLALEGGFGFDFYYPLFKFSPEIRFSRGINNLLSDSDNPFGVPLKRINTNTITVYLLFQ